MQESPGSLRSRFLQLSENDNTQFQDDDAGSPVVLIMFGVIALLIVTQVLHSCITRQSSLLAEPSLQNLLYLRRRGREEIRRRRLEGFILPTGDTTEQPIERLQLTADQKETREKELLHMFEARNVQLVLAEENFIKDENITDFDEDQKNLLMVKLPDRKPLQPDLVPNTCAICLESFAIGEIAVWSNNEECQHAFHQDCILEYLVPLNPEKECPCPCCRLPFYVAVEGQSQSIHADSGPARTNTHSRTDD